MKKIFFFVKHKLFFNVYGIKLEGKILKKQQTV